MQDFHFRPDCRKIDLSQTALRRRTQSFSRGPTIGIGISPFSPVSISSISCRITNWVLNGSCGPPRYQAQALLRFSPPSDLAWACYGGDARTGVAFLREFRAQVAEPSLRAIIDRRLQALETVLKLETAVATFRDQYSRLFRTKEFVEKGFIDEIPPDPYGGEWGLSRMAGSSVRASLPCYQQKRLFPRIRYKA